ncbi:MAG: PHP domain-containing protein [Ignavibacteriaceae bacterium]|nr:PHP domain-containing protein [Ignavibacteriaceae bacterium]
MKTLRTFIPAFILLFVIAPLLLAQGNNRSEINIPNLPGYVTLKCDFHIHTVFSDGNVWPTVRVEEAWRDGLDAIALTDHIEYQPHSKDVPTNFNRPYELAKPLGDKLDIIVIKGSEVTRKMPPGHLNAIFLKDADKLKTDDWRDALKAAKEQGAFIFWNHPNWKAHQKDGIARWYDEHSYLLENGLLNGIEVLNGYTFSPNAQNWCLEYNLAFMGDSDVHDPIRMEYNYMGKQRRPITLVFAKEKTEAAIKEALFAGRTAVIFNDTLIGKKEYLLPIFNASIKYNKNDIVLKKKDSFSLQVTNQSDLTYILSAKNITEEINCTHNVTLLPSSTSIIEISTGKESQSGRYTLVYQISNFWTASGEHSEITLPIHIEVE